MILIAGATGYIGRYLCKYMVEQGKDILALGRSPEVKDFLSRYSIPYQYFDLLDTNSYTQLPTAKIEAVINLAAVLAEIETPVSDMFAVNTIGTYNLLEFCRSRGVSKFVLASTHKVYNEINHIPLHESEHPSFSGDHSPYIISKVAAENFVEYYNKEFGMQGIILRLTGVHGYGEILGHLQTDGSYKKSTFEIFVEKALKGETIEVWGDCKAVRDHIYIKDILTAFEAATESSSARGVYNIATGVGLTLMEEAQGIVEVFSPHEKRSTIIQRNDKQAFTRSYVYDISKAKKDLNWQPKYSFLDMLRDYRYEQGRRVFHHYHYIKPDQVPATI
jgi:UDP-glucose 4-epimerase